MSAQQAPSRDEASWFDGVRRRLPVEALAVPAVMIVASLLAVADDAAPTGHGTADGVWRALAGAAIVMCATFAPPFAWVVAATLAAASSGQTSHIVVGVLAIAVAGVGAWRYPDLTWVGALVGLAVSWVVFRLPHADILGMSTLVAAAVVAPLLIGAWYWGPDGIARSFTLGATIIGVGCVTGALVLGVTTFMARSDINDAIDLADDAEQSFRDGDEQRATRLLTQAIDKLQSAEDRTTAPWVRATRLVPVVGQHTRAVQTVITAGRHSADAALDVLSGFDREQLAVVGGRVDLAAVRDITPRIDALVEATAATRARLRGVRSPWLLPLLDTSLDDADDEVVDILRASRRAADAARLAPMILGGDGPRNHLILLVTTAELRGSGGLIGNWALIQADDGRLRLTEVGRAADVNDLLVPLDLELTDPEEYVARYRGNAVETEFWDTTLSPDFPDVADVAAQLFEAATGTPIDSVMLVDPDGAAALMRLTGPVDVDGRVVDAQTLRDFLLVGQYTDFADDDLRQFFLERLLTETFSKLLTVDFRDPWDLDEVFDDVVREDRLVIDSTTPAEHEILDGLGLTGAFPAIEAGTQDLLGVVTQNGGQNKADAFLQRSVEYQVDIDPETGRLEASVTVELTNTLTDLTLPGAIVGSNDQGLPTGTNLSAVTVYSPHELTGFRIDGVEDGAQAVPEFGVNSYTRLVEIPSGQTVTLELDLAGELDVGDAYRLVVPVQAAATPDRFRYRVSAPPGTLLDGSRTSWQTSLTTAADQEFVVDVDPA